MSATAQGVVWEPGYTYWMDYHVDWGGGDWRILYGSGGEGTAPDEPRNTADLTWRTDVMVDGVPDENGDYGLNLVWFDDVAFGDGTLTDDLMGHWFVTGGSFEGLRLHTDGSVTATMPDSDEPSALDWLLAA